MTQQSTENAQQSAPSFVGHHAPPLQEVHRILDHLHYLKTVLLQHLLPITKCEWANIGLDAHGQIFLDGAFHLRRDLVWIDADLVNAIESARLEQSGRLFDDGILLRCALHGEHRLAVHFRSASVGQTRLSGIGHDELHRGIADVLPNAFGGFLVQLDGSVRMRLPRHGESSRVAQSRSKLHHIVGLCDVHSLQHPVREFLSARPQHAFS